MLNFDGHGTRYNPSESVLNKQTVKSLQQVWTAPMVNAPFQPAVAGGVVYASSTDQVYAFDAVSGTPIWSVAVDNNCSSPAIANGVVYAANCTGILYAFDAATGKTLWTSQAGFRSDCVISPIVSGGQVFIRADSSGVYAFNARTGKLQWDATQPSGACLDALVVTNGVVISTNGKYDVVAHDARTGVEIWEYSRKGSIASETLTTDGTRVYVYFIADGSLADQRGWASWGLVTALDAKSGHLVWQKNAGKYHDVAGALALEKNHLYLFEQNINCYWIFDTNSGAAQSIKPKGGIIQYSPTLANHVLYESNGGGFFALDPKTGELLGGGGTGNGAVTSPVVANGMVYVVGVYGGLYAFGLKN